MFVLVTLGNLWKCPVNIYKKCWNSGDVSMLTIIYAWFMHPLMDEKLANATALPMTRPKKLASHPEQAGASSLCTAAFSSSLIEQKEKCSGVKSITTGSASVFWKDTSLLNFSECVFSFLSFDQGKVPSPLYMRQDRSLWLISPELRSSHWSTLGRENVYLCFVKEMFSENEQIYNGKATFTGSFMTLLAFPILLVEDGQYQQVTAAWFYAFS